MQVYLSAQTCCGHCRLEDAGTGVGLRLVELLCFRDKTSRREIRLLDALKFVHSVLWKYLFGRQARDLEQSNMVTVHMPCVSRCTALKVQHLL